MAAFLFQCFKMIFFYEPVKLSSLLVTLVGVTQDFSSFKLENVLIYLSGTMQDEEEYHMDKLH